MNLFNEYQGGREDLGGRRCFIALTALSTILSAQDAMLTTLRRALLHGLPKISPYRSFHVGGLKDDAEAIFAYFGQDFIQPRKTKNPALFSHSTGHSFGVSAISY
jgi:hypothetical protein